MLMEMEKCFEKKIKVWIATFISLNIKHKTLNIQYYLNLNHNTLETIETIYLIVIPQESLINLSVFLTKWLDEKRIMRIQLPSNSSDLNPLQNLNAFNLKKLKTAALKHEF